MCHYAQWSRIGVTVWGIDDSGLEARTGVTARLLRGCGLQTSATGKVVLTSILFNDAAGRLIKTEGQFFKDGYRCCPRWKRERP